MATVMWLTGEHGAQKCGKMKFESTTARVFPEGGVLPHSCACANVFSFPGDFRGMACASEGKG